MDPAFGRSFLLLDKPISLKGKSGEEEGYGSAKPSDPGVDCSGMVGSLWNNAAPAGN
jgi:hypothetical protein